MKQIEELKTMNIKLYEDNRTLLMECVRLKKIVNSSTNVILEQQVAKFKELEVENLFLLNEVNKLQTEKIRLQSEGYGS